MLAARALLQGISQYKTVTHVAALVGALVREHLEWVHFRQEHRYLATHISKETAKATTERHRRAVGRHTIERFGDPLAWDQTFAATVGGILVELVCLHSGLVEKQTHFVRQKRKRSVVTLTDDAKLILELGHMKAEDMTPIWMPMVCRPIPWTSPTDGGYVARRLPLVKLAREAYLEELENTEMPTVYNALNALQDTPWKINKAVLSVFQKLFAAGDQLALPGREDIPLPAKPHDIDINDEARREWRIEAARVYDYNARLVSKRVATATKLSLAERFAD